MTYLNKFALATVLWTCGFPVAACSYYFGIGVFFEKDSKIISPSETKRLTDWAEKTRSQFLNAESIVIDVTSEQGERDAVSLGRHRELAVRLALIDLGISAPEFYVSDRIDVRPPGLGVGAGSHDVKRVEIQYIPQSFYYGKCLQPIENAQARMQ